MFKQNSFLAILLISSVILSLFSCKQHHSKEYKLLQGKWEIILLDNMNTVGKIYFKDSMMKTTIDFLSEEAVFSIKKDTLFIRRVGGITNLLSGEGYWIIEKISNNFFRLHSSEGKILTAFKPELTDPNTGAPKEQ